MLPTSWIICFDSGLILGSNDWFCRRSCWRACWSGWLLCACFTTECGSPGIRKSMSASLTIIESWLNSSWSATDLRSLTKCFISNVERFAFMSRTYLRPVWHINHVVRDNKSHCSLMCLFNVEIRPVFRWTCVDYTRLMNGFSRNGSRDKSPRSLWRTTFFFAKRITIDLLRTERFSFILHTDHVLRDIGSPRSLTIWI